ncbi:MAG: hypothetical protein HC789_04605 [Microcoleus sp. CSU_2_2]|nr:hypothetical protein [Microcoleus sp. CSU_2_2]
MPNPTKNLDASPLQVLAKGEAFASQNPVFSYRLSRKCFAPTGTHTEELRTPTKETGFFRESARRNEYFQRNPVSGHSSQSKKPGFSEFVYCHEVFS